MLGNIKVRNALIYMLKIILGKTDYARGILAEGGSVGGGFCQGTLKEI